MAEHVGIHCSTLGQLTTRTTPAPTVRQQPGERCGDCGCALSRYNPDRFCRPCQQRHDEQGWRPETTDGGW